MGGRSDPKGKKVKHGGMGVRKQEALELEGCYHDEGLFQEFFGGAFLFGWGLIR